MCHQFLIFYSPLKQISVSLNTLHQICVHHGNVSGYIQKIKEIRIDDDQDAIWMIVDIGDGASCHVGYKSCFYRAIPLGKSKNFEKIEMTFKEKEKKFDPKKVYKDQQNPTKL